MANNSYGLGFLSFSIKVPSDFRRLDTLILRMSPVRSLILHTAEPSVVLTVEPLKLMVTSSISLTFPGVKKMINGYLMYRNARKGVG